MKIYKKELNGQGKYRVFMVLGKGELEMLVGILSKAYQYFPNSVSYSQENDRLRLMVKIGQKALKYWGNMEIEK